MTRNRLPLVLLAAAALATGGCKRSSGPSPAYAECQKTWEKALAAKGADAFSDPAAAAAQKLCESVPADSSDSEVARALAKRIADGRSELDAQAKRLAAASVMERAAPEVSLEVVQDQGGRAPPVEALDGGTPAPGLPTVGSSADDFKKRYGACVKFVSKFDEKGGKRQGEAWGLEDKKTACAKDFPELVGQLVALADGKVFNVVAAATVERTERVETVDAGFVKVDAGWTPRGKETVIEENLGSVLPGQPVPAGGTVQ